MSEVTEVKNEEVEEEVTLIQRIARLFKVKSIVTLMLGSAFTYLSIIGKISAEQFLTIFTVIVSFYFGVQTSKGKE